MIQERADNLSNRKRTDNKDCSVCNELLLNMGRFLDMLETVHRSSTSEWLTVDDISKELKVSKSIVYRLIRRGDLEAVDLVDSNGKISQKGHYRIKRSSLSQYLEAKKVRPFPSQKNDSYCRHVPKVKNHLGL
jgi:excisionase family DNA binding protein